MSGLNALIATLYRSTGLVQTGAAILLSFTAAWEKAGAALAMIACL